MFLKSPNKNKRYYHLDKIIYFQILQKCILSLDLFEKQITSHNFFFLLFKDGIANLFNFLNIHFISLEKSIKFVFEIADQN